jgi:hypothetical protein
LKEHIITNSLYKFCFESFPDTAVIIDSDYTVLHKNDMFSSFFGQEENPERAQKKARKCYALLGKDQPCESCPLKKNKAGIMVEYEGRSETLSQNLNQKKISEKIIRLPEMNSSMLVFKNTSHELGLMDQIVKHQETIKLQKKVFQNIIRFSQMLEKEQNVETAVEFFLDVILSNLGVNRGIVIAGDIRDSSLWFISEKNVGS